MTTHRYIPDVATLTLEPAACTGCGMCTQVCPHAVFRLPPKPAQMEGTHRARRVVEIAHRDACMECGACVLNCPTGALAVTPGVGCAAAILYGLLHGTEPDCGSGWGTGNGEGGSCC